MVGNLFGLVMAGRQFYALMTAALVRILPFLAILLAVMLGLADKCTREADRNVRTLTDFLNFAATLWDRYVMREDPEANYCRFPSRLEPLWLMREARVA